MTVSIGRGDGGVDEYMRFGDAYIKNGDGTLDVIGDDEAPVVVAFAPDVQIVQVVGGEGHTCVRTQLGAAWDNLVRTHDVVREALVQLLLPVPLFQLLV